jgi:hypothetical protein
MMMIAHPHDIVFYLYIADARLLRTVTHYLGTVLNSKLFDNNIQLASYSC